MSQPVGFLPVNLGDLIDHRLDPGRTAVIDLREPEAPRTWTHGEIDGLSASCP